MSRLTWRGLLALDSLLLVVLFGILGSRVYAEARDHSIVAQGSRVVLTSDPIGSVNAQWRGTNPVFTDGLPLRLLQIADTGFDPSSSSVSTRMFDRDKTSARDFIPMVSLEVTDAVQVLDPGVAIRGSVRLTVEFPELRDLEEEYRLRLFERDFEPAAERDGTGARPRERELPPRERYGFAVTKKDIEFPVSLSIGSPALWGVPVWVGRNVLFLVIAWLVTAVSWKVLMRRRAHVGKATPSQAQLVLRIAIATAATLFCLGFLITRLSDPGSPTLVDIVIALAGGLAANVPIALIFWLPTWVDFFESARAG